MSNKNTAEIVGKIEVAELLGVQPRHVVALVRRGTIPKPVRGLCPMPTARKPRLEETPEWDREAVVKAWAQRGEA